MWSRGCWDSRCSADSESGRCSSACLDDARAGHGGALVLHGEPGVGKTALLDLAVELGDGFDVVRTAGVEGEIGASLRRAPAARPADLRSERGPARSAARSPLRRVRSRSRTRAEPVPRRARGIGSAVRSRGDRPVLCVVDDAQWLDRASARALAFIARRLLAERIGLLFAARERDEAFAGLPELHVGPLGRRDARILLESVLPTRVDDQVLERIVAETHGNPLALLELPRGMTPAQLAGGFGLPAALPLSARIEEHFMRRVANVPPDARRLLLLAAADPTGDLALVSRAAQGLGIDEAAARALESDGLLDSARRRRRSVTRWRGRPCTAQPRWMSGARCIERSRMPRTRRRTPTAAHGIARRRRRCRTRTSPRSSSVRRRERRRAAGSPRPPRSSSAPRS